MLRINIKKYKLLNNEFEDTSSDFFHLEKSMMLGIRKKIKEINDWENFLPTTFKKLSILELEINSFEKILNPTLEDKALICAKSFSKENQKFLELLIYKNLSMNLIKLSINNNI